MMKADAFQIDGRRLRILLAIASHGEKNVGFLREIIKTYQSLPAEVDIVVVSNIPKDLGAGVRVVVGLPGKDPWTLPFAHKKVFAESVEKYDLFIFSEDDIGITSKNIEAFLEATPQLADDEIAGYIRYEVDGKGNWSLPDVHGVFRWNTKSVARHGDYMVAEFTNEHAGYYILMQAQLRRAIASGGFLNEPYAARYGLPETAATDPYTRCGFRKVICISALDDFLIHHMPNRYVGRLGIPLESFKQQIETLAAIQNGSRLTSTLCPVESNFPRQKWSKDLYEKPNAAVLGALPAKGKRILSVACGWGATEIKLEERGASVTAFPVDSVFGAHLERSKIEVVSGALAECFQQVSGRKFDGVLLMNLLHLLPDPEAVLGQCASLLEDGGVMIVVGPNFGRVKTVAKRILHKQNHGALSSYDESGINILGPRRLSKWLKRAGMNVSPAIWSDPDGRYNNSHDRTSRWTAEEWALQARR
jgi:2-polyprenyl-3-methyl-5-hydroxy-6-metoxy-1,4-benzoquinol methylase